MGKSIQAPTVMPKQTVWLPEIPEGFCPAIIYRAQQAPHSSQIGLQSSPNYVLG